MSDYTYSTYTTGDTSEGTTISWDDYLSNTVVESNGYSIKLSEALEWIDDKRKPKKKITSFLDIE